MTRMSPSLTATPAIEPVEVDTLVCAVPGSVPPSWGLSRRVATVVPVDGRHTLITAPQTSMLDAPAPSNAAPCIVHAPVGSVCAASGRDKKRRNQFLCNALVPAVVNDTPTCAVPIV